MDFGLYTLAVGLFLFAVTRERVTDARPSRTRPTARRFYSLLRESGSLTSPTPSGPGSMSWFLFAVTRERVTDNIREFQNGNRKCFYSLLRESGSLTREDQQQVRQEFLFAVTRERVTDMPPLAEQPTPTSVSIRCYARAGH